MRHNKFVYLLLALMITIFFQNCGVNPSVGKPEQAGVSEVESSSVLQQSGNGVGYGGKPGDYGFFDLEDPCEDLDMNENPLPNKKVKISNLPFGPEAFVVRENYHNLLIPRPVLVSLIQVITDTRMFFEGLIFNLIEEP